MSNGKKLKELIARDGIVVMPGVYDAASAKMVEQAGFSAAYVTGSGLHASLMGCPDMDILTMNEIVDQTKRICQAVNIPIFADAEEGFGGIPNVMRTVQLLEEAGAAAMHLDDEVSPGKCPYLYPDVKQELLSINDMCEKIEAAVAAKKDKDTLIVVRCDTRGSVYDTGGEDYIEETIKRLNAYAEAGADCLYPSTPKYEDYKRICQAIDFPYKVCVVSPQIANIPGYDLHLHTPEEWLKDTGCNIMLAPLFTITTSMKYMKEALVEFKNTGIQPKDSMISFDEYNDVLSVSNHGLFKGLL